MADVIKGHCQTVEFMGDLEGGVSDTSHGNSANAIKRAEELLNSDAVGRQFGSADVYDDSLISLTSGKIPGSRWITDKNNDRRKGRGAGWTGRREANCAELRENPGEIDNH